MQHTEKQRAKLAQAKGALTKALAASERPNLPGAEKTAILLTGITHAILALLEGSDED